MDELLAACRARPNMCEPTAAVGVRHMDCSCRPWLTCRDDRRARFDQPPPGVLDVVELSRGSENAARGSGKAAKMQREAVGRQGKMPREAVKRQ